METIRHDGRETAYRLAGARGADAEGTETETLLYVHGSGATHRLWAQQYAPDGPGERAVVLDLSGHGDSPDVDTEPGTETLDAYARDVTAVARETDADVLVGNSLGGAVVQWVALESDFDPTAIVLAGTGAKLAVRKDLREMLAEDFDAAVGALHGVDLLFHDADERTVQRSRQQMRATGQRVTERDFLTCHRFDVRDRLPEIDVPALALVGEHDGLTPPQFHEYLADGIPRCAYAEIADAAHLAMVERPGAFNDAVAGFLDGLDD